MWVATLCHLLGEYHYLVGISGLLACISKVEVHRVRIQSIYVGKLHEHPGCVIP